jgi:hypothetical protein
MHGDIGRCKRGSKIDLWKSMHVDPFVALERLEAMFIPRHIVATVARLTTRRRWLLGSETNTKHRRAAQREGDPYVGVALALRRPTMFCVRFAAQ